MHGLKKLQHFLPWQQALKDSIYNKKKRKLYTI